MTQYHILRISYSALAGFVACAILAIGIFFNIKPAQATPGMLPFGGPILINIPTAIPNPAMFFALCPAHIVILDYSFGVPKPIGISTLGATNATPGLIFDWGNLYTPWVETLGEDIPFPLPTCAGLPYPVFQGFFNPLFGKFQIGTGAIPGT